MKRNIKASIDAIEQASKEIDKVRDHFDMEWGQNAHSELDVELIHAQRQLEDAKRALDDVLTKFQGKRLRPNFPRPKKARKEYTVKDLQQALCC